MKRYIGLKIVDAEPGLCPAGGRGEHPEGVDGYKVVYKDGYTSWYPRDVFEEAYRPMAGMSFGIAIEAMKQGHRVARKGWNGRGIFIELQNPTDLSKMTHPYIFIDTTGLQSDNEHAPRDLVPWLASQTDMLSDDWQIVA